VYSWVKVINSLLYGINLGVRKCDIYFGFFGHGGCLTFIVCWADSDLLVVLIDRSLIDC